MLGPLDGIKVVDLSRFISGPYCGLLLADMGAEVVKVEKKGGEDTRHAPPFVKEDSLYAASLNRNKRAITLDFRHELAGEVLTRLFKWADIIIENFRPGTLEKMGFSPEVIHEINPRAIITRCSGFGQSGPYSSRPGFDAIGQAMSGLMSMTGREEDPPLLSGTFVVDYATGLHAAVGTLSALYRRNETGKGQVVDVSLYESAVSMLVAAIPTYYLTGQLPQRVGNGDRYAAPVNAYKAKDGWIYLSAPNNGLWKKLCELMKREDLLTQPHLKTEADRVKHKKELDEIVQKWVSPFTMEEVLNLLIQKGIPCAPVQNIDDLLQDSHLKDREQIVYLEHPTAGKMPLSGVTIKLSDTPGKIRYNPPLVGQNNEEIYQNELGYSKYEFNQLKAKGVL